MTTPDRTPTEQAPKGRRRRDALLHLLKNGPFAIASSALQGAVNYFIVVYLIYIHGAADTGQYRLLFSYFSLLGLATIYETSKVFIRSIVSEDRWATVSLFANRLTFAIGAASLLAIGHFVGKALGQAWVPVEVVWIGLISVVFYPTDSYIALYQARGQFMRLFFTELAKYGLSLTVFLASLSLGASVVTATLLQLGTMALFQAILFSLVVREFIDIRMLATRFAEMLKSKPAQQARTLSLANLFPASLEHLDKMVVGAVFGLEILGVYTLAYSTGRFLYNTLKPALYIYYRRFVDKMPGRKLLWLVSLGFTALGAVMAVAFVIAVERLPFMAKFKDGEVVTVILFLGYGVGILNALYVQAFSLNKESDGRHALWSSISATGLSLFLLGGALLCRPSVAFILLALQYPVRDGARVLFISHFRRRQASLNVDAPGQS